MRDRIIAGDTLDFVTTFVGYPAATWTCTYYFVPRVAGSGTAFSVVCTAGTEADAHRCAAAAATTALWTPAEYSWFARVTSGSESYSGDAWPWRGSVTLLPNPATATTYDARSVAEKALEDAESALATYQASGGKVKRYSIGGREMEFSEGGELLKQISYWRIQVKRERAAASVANGMADPRRIYLRAGRA
jgi:hypothetical protein